jgi:hypothetical protein
MAQVIIRRDDGTEEVIREVENSFRPDYELLFNEDFIAKILWIKEDIEAVLQDTGFEKSEENCKKLLDYLEGSGLLEELESSPIGHDTFIKAIYEGKDFMKLSKAKEKGDLER